MSEETGCSVQLVELPEQEQWPPVWAYRLLAGLHFLRVLVLLSAVSIQLLEDALFSLSFDPLLVVGFLPIISIELPLGFFILMRKKWVILPLVIYLTFPCLGFLVMSLYHPTFNFIYLVFSTCLIEMVLVVFLGGSWINREWVRNSSSRYSKPEVNSTH